MKCYCLVSIPTPLVAQDLALTLQDLTGCTAIVAGRAEKALAMVADVEPGALKYAVVHSGSIAFRSSPLRAAIEARGGRVVLMGHAAELEVAGGKGGESWPVLIQPFGRAQVAALIKRLERASTPFGSPQKSADNSAGDHRDSA